MQTIKNINEMPFYDILTSHAPFSDPFNICRYVKRKGGEYRDLDNIWKNQFYLQTSHDQNPLLCE